MSAHDVDAIRDAIETLLVEHARELVRKAFDHDVQAEPGTPVFRMRQLLIEGPMRERDLVPSFAGEPFVVVERKWVLFARMEDAFAESTPPAIVPKVDQVRCRCRHRDRERCASDRQLVEVACSCECHKRGRLRA